MSFVQRHVPIAAQKLVALPFQLFIQVFIFSSRCCFNDCFFFSELLASSIPVICNTAVILLSDFGFFAKTSISLPEFLTASLFPSSFTHSVPHYRGKQPFKPASLTTRFHPHPHPPPRLRETSVERLRSLTVLQSPFLQLPSVRIHKPNLLEPRVVIR
jgi:hypothetical protein